VLVTGWVSRPVRFDGCRRRRRRCRRYMAWYAVLLRLGPGMHPVKGGDGNLLWRKSPSALQSVAS